VSCLRHLITLEPAANELSIQGHHIYLTFDTVSTGHRSDFPFSLHALPMSWKVNYINTHCIPNVQPRGASIQYGYIHNFVVVNVA